MGRTKGLMATDEMERQILEKVAAAPDGRRRAAIEALQRKSRDRIDEMWGGSPMRIGEARKLAAWLGYELRLIRTVPTQKARAYTDADARGQPAREQRRAAGSSG